VRAMLEKIRTAHTISLVNGYDRYVDQLEKLRTKFMGGEPRLEKSA